MTPVTTLAAYREHRSGSAISTLAMSSMRPPSSAYERSGSVIDSPVTAATSWATPSTERQSGRFGVSSSSKTASPR